MLSRSSDSDKNLYGSSKQGPPPRGVHGKSPRLHPIPIRSPSPLNQPRFNSLSSLFRSLLIQASPRFFSSNPRYRSLPRCARLLHPQIQRGHQRRSRKHSIGGPVDAVLVGEDGDVHCLPSRRRGWREEGEVVKWIGEVNGEEGEVVERKARLRNTKKRRTGGWVRKVGLMKERHEDRSGLASSPSQARFPLALPT